MINKLKIFIRMFGVFLIWASIIFIPYYALRGIALFYDCTEILNKNIIGVWVLGAFGLLILSVGILFIIAASIALYDKIKEFF